MVLQPSAAAADCSQALQVPGWGHTFGQQPRSGSRDCSLCGATDPYRWKCASSFAVFRKSGVVSDAELFALSGCASPAPIASAIYSFMKKKYKSVINFNETTPRVGVRCVVL